MGWAVFKVDDNGEERFLVWSSVVDAPISFALTAKEFGEFVVHDAVRDARETAARMLQRARETGTSSRMVSSLADVLCVNRAGPRESKLTKDEVLEFYVRRKEEPTAAALREYRQKRKAARRG